jgi:DNA-binding response OmpR family regulator
VGQAAEDTVPEGPGKVLLVEDDEPTADLIEDMLIEIGYRDVIRAMTVEEALTTIKSSTFSMVVLDANLRGVPAHNVATELRRRGIPFIVSTGYDPERLPGSFRFGVSLRKPYGRRDLVKALATAQGDS